MIRVVGRRREDDLPRRADPGREGDRSPADAFGAGAHDTGQQFHREVRVFGTSATNGPEPARPSVATIKPEGYGERDPPLSGSVWWRSWWGGA